MARTQNQINRDNQIVNALDAILKELKGISISQKETVAEISKLTLNKRGK